MGDWHSVLDDWLHEEFKGDPRLATTLSFDIKLLLLHMPASYRIGMAKELLEGTTARLTPS